MTNLTLNPDAEDYSEQAEREVLDAVGVYWRDRLSVIDAINIRSARED